jgi:hypothetical protein
MLVMHGSTGATWRNRRIQIAGCNYNPKRDKNTSNLRELPLLEVTVLKYSYIQGEGERVEEGRMRHFCSLPVRLVSRTI